MMVNNFTNINETNNLLSLNIKKDHNKFARRAITRISGPYYVHNSEKIVSCYLGACYQVILPLCENLLRLGYSVFIVHCIWYINYIFLHFKQGGFFSIYKHLHFISYGGLEVRVLVFHATFNNISVLLVEEDRVPRKINPYAATHWQTLSHNVVSNNEAMSGIQTHNFSGDIIGTDCIGCCKSNYCMITTTADP